MKLKVLVVDDEPEILETCAEILNSGEVEVHTEGRSPLAAERISSERFDLLITDVRMPDMDGLALLEHTRVASQTTRVVLLTGFPAIETAVDAVKNGAFDFLAKPFTPDKLRCIVERVLKSKKPAEGSRFEKLLGRSARMEEVFRLIDKVAATNTDVLIYGESGTGKELVAQSIHARGKQREGEFVPIDCGAIPENLLENELFGHERGAYTGAQLSRKGLMELAHRGTLFLDEVGELPSHLQAKLLRVLQERQFRKIGGSDLVEVDIRVIAATNRDLACEIKEKKFREDLFYRLNVVPIRIPSLRERREDIPLLADHFLKQYAAQWEKTVATISPEVLEVLERYSWPGNIRELENTIKRAIIFCDGDALLKIHLPPEVFGGRAEGEKDYHSFKVEKMNLVEWEFFRTLLIRYEGDVARIARETDIPRGTVYRLLKKHSLKPHHFKT